MTDNRQQFAIDLSQITKITIQIRNGTVLEAPITGVTRCNLSAEMGGLGLRNPYSLEGRRIPIESLRGYIIELELRADTLTASTPFPPSQILVDDKATSESDTGQIKLGARGRKLRIVEPKRVLDLSADDDDGGNASQDPGQMPEPVMKDEWLVTVDLIGSTFSKGTRKAQWKAVLTHPNYGKQACNHSHKTPATARACGRLIAKRLNAANR